MALAAPLLIAFDGSETAKRAVEAAAELFTSRTVLVATVWEPDLAYGAAAMPSLGMEMQPVPIDIGQAHELEHDLQEQARRTAEAGTAMAREAGLEAEGIVLAGAKPADSIVELARKRNVAAIVVGSRGLSGISARLEGSTSKRILGAAHCPVVVVHAEA